MIIIPIKKNKGKNWYKQIVYSQCQAKRYFLRARKYLKIADDFDSKYYSSTITKIKKIIVTFKIMSKVYNIRSYCHYKNKINNDNNTN